MTRTRDLEYIAERLDAVHGQARDPEVRARVTTAKARPTREDIVAKLDKVYEGAKADGNSRGMAGARLAKLRLSGEIDEAEYKSRLGEDEDEDPDEWPD